MGYFVEEFDPINTRDFMSWMREDDDAGDRWGWAMSWLFDIAGEMCCRGLDTDFLQYRPGAGGPDISDDRADGLALIGSDALEYGARVLNRYTARLRAAGLDY